MSEQNIVNVMVIPDVPKVLPGEQLYVYVPKASFTFPGIIAYNNTQFRIDGNFLFIREDYVSPGVQQKIDELKQYTDDELQLKQDKEDNNISLAQRPEQKSVVGAINDLGTLTGQAQDTADDAIRKIGNLSTLTTDEKSTAVNAINEVDQHTNVAQSTADEATNLANTGISKADQAQATADTATTLANTGISKADQAQSTANTAVDKANDAKATANEAIMKADGRSNSIGFMTAKDAVTALNGYPRTQLKGGDTIWIVETGTPDLWVTEVAQESVPYNYTTKDKFNQDLVDNKVLQIGYFKTAYQESDGKPVTIAWQNVLVKSTDWVASTEFADFPYEAKIELTDFVDYTTVPQVVFDIADTMSGNYAPICKSGDKCVYIYGKVQNEITLKTVITFAPNVNGASVTGGGYNNRGKWVASTTYEIDDLVYTDNGQFVCIEGITSTTSPEQDTTHWQATFVATGKTKNGLTISGQNADGSAVQKTFDGSQAVEVAFDETTMTAKEVNGVLKVGAKGTIPEALPQEASALKRGSLPTSGWNTTPKTLYDGQITYGRYGSSGRIYENFLPPFEYSAHTARSDWQGTQLYGNSITNVSALEGGVKLAVRFSDGNDHYVLRIYNTGTVNAWTYNDRDTNGTAQIKVTFLSNWLYTISDTSITANSDVLMELTDDGGVKSYSMEAGSITVFRDTLPTQSIPYTYKVKQTNASGQFTLVNHFVPSIPESPTSLPVTYKKVSGSLPTSGWISLDEGWKQNTLPANTDWKSVTYGDDKFVAGEFYSDKGAYWKAAADVTYTISDIDITANTSVKMYLTDEGGVKAQSKANGSITVIRDSVPTTAIPYEYEVEQTSTPGGFDVINSYVPTVPTKTSELTNDSNFATTSDIPAKTSQLTNDSGFITQADVPTIPTKTSQLENDSNFAKTNVSNSWGSTQTFTAYDGIKTNRICNAAGTSLVDGTGTTNKFGNGNMPTIIKTSEARPKAEVPYADGTVTRQIALLEDIPSMVIDWVGPSATEQVITGTGMRQIFAEFTDTVGEVSTLYKFYGEVYVDGQNEVNGTSSTVYSTNTEGTELHVITVTPTIRRNTDNQFVLRAECCRYTIGASPMSINKSYLSFVFRKRLY